MGDLKVTHPVLSHIQVFLVMVLVTHVEDQPRENNNQDDR